MKIAMVDVHDSNYLEMAAMTVPVKQRYAEKHGYEFLCKNENLVPNLHVGFQKCFYIADLMKERPDVDWFWHAGTDCLITNHNIKLESLIDDNFHFIVTKDDHGICADIFFIKNSEEGRRYMEHLKQPHPASGTEQGHMWDDEHNPEWRQITKYLSQNAMNSYDKDFYPHKGFKDRLGGKLNWEPGDFLLHAISGLHPQFTPRQALERKLVIIKKNLSHVIF